MPNFKPVNFNQHGQHKVKKHTEFEHAKGRHLIPLVMHEFVSSAHDYPIVFVKDSETGEFRACALMGLKPNTNVFFDDGVAAGRFVPGNLALYPFALIRESEESDQAALCFDVDCPLVNTDEGNALFDQDGKQSEYGNEVGQSLVEYNRRVQMTREFAKLLSDLNLIRAQNLDVENAQGEKHSVTGLYIIDEKALYELADETFLDIKNKGLLAPIFAALQSLSLVRNLT